MEETFTINLLELPRTLRRCLGTTNIIESPHAGVRLRTNRVSRWRDGKMVLRWGLRQPSWPLKRTSAASWLP